GKSSLVNALLGEERVIVSSIPGTTIDTTDTEIMVNEQPFTLIDTAGLRRRGKREPGLEQLSSFRALRAVYRSDIALLILDYQEGVNKQDCHVSQYVLEASKGMVIVVNKCDLMDEKEADRDKFISMMRRKMSYLPWAPVIFVSALTKSNIVKIFEVAKEINDERNKVISDKELEMFIHYLVAQRPPPSRGKQPIKIKQVSQTGTLPPEFTFVTNFPDAMHFSYRRFLENQLREKYGFVGTSIRMRFKKEE
ncbi:MAG: GTPase, partial [Patescibacteria group bacterium]